MPANTSPSADIPPSHPGPDAQCSIEDHPILEKVNAEELLAMIDQENQIQDPTLLADLQSVCSESRDSNKIAEVKNFIVDFEGKRRKLYGNFNDLNTCPRDPFIPFKRDRKRHIFKAVTFILEHQNDVLDASDFIANSKWIEYIFNPDNPVSSHYTCHFCSRYIQDSNHVQWNVLSDISGVLREGVDAKRQNKEVIQHHARLPTHKKVMERFEEQYLQEIRQEIQGDIIKNEPVQFKVTNRHMRFVFQLCKSHLPLSAHLKFAEVERKNGLPMGNKCKSQDTAKNMAKSISDMYLQDLKQSLLESDSYVSILADGGCDNTLQHYVSVLFQFINSEKNIKVAFYKLIPLGVSSTGEAYYEALRSELTKDNLWDYFGQRLTSMATDSANNMIGDGKGFSTRMKAALGRPNALVHTCMAHNLELILDIALKKNVCPNCYSLDKILKAIYEYFHRSPKRSASLKKYCEEHYKGRKCYRLKRIVPTRWVSSHLIAAKELYDGWDILVSFLLSLQTDVDYIESTESNQKTKKLGAAIAHLLLQKDFLSSLAFQIDVQMEFTAISQFLQRRGQSILGAYNQKKRLVSGLTNIHEGTGLVFNQLLREAKCGGIESCHILSKYEDDSTEVTWRGLSLLDAMPEGEVVEEVPIDCDEFLMGYNVVEIESNVNPPRKRGRKKNCNTNSQTNETEEDKEAKVDKIKFEKLSLHKDSYIDKLRKKVEEKMPTTELTTTVSYLDPSEWPLNVRSILANAEMKTHIEKWPTLFGLTLAPNVMWNEFEKVVIYLEENPDFWCANHYADTTDFYSLLLKKMTDMPANFQRVLSMSLVVPASTADPER